jgi:hypothetical protein
MGQIHIVLVRPTTPQQGDISGTGGATSDAGVSRIEPPPPASWCHSLTGLMMTLPPMSIPSPPAVFIKIVAPALVKDQIRLFLADRSGQKGLGRIVKCHAITRPSGRLAGGAGMNNDKLEEFLVRFISEYASKPGADYKMAERIFDLRWKPELKIEEIGPLFHRLAWRAGARVREEGFNEFNSQYVMQISRELAAHLAEFATVESDVAEGISDITHRGC